MVWRDMFIRQKRGKPTAVPLGAWIIASCESWIATMFCDGCHARRGLHGGIGGSYGMGGHLAGEKWGS